MKEEPGRIPDYSVYEGRPSVRYSTGLRATFPIRK